MKKFRFQFSLRTLFIFSFLVAIVCALYKCKKDAENNFVLTTHVVHEALERIEQEADQDLYNSWQKEAKANPTFPSFVKLYPAEKDRIPIVVQKQNSHIDCLGLNDVFFIRRRLLSPKTDFSQTTSEDDLSKIDAIAANFAIVGARYYGIFSQKPSISIHALKVPQSDFFLTRLKTELTKAGLTYKIEEVAIEDWYPH